MKFIVRRIGRSVEISEATSSLLLYRIPYQNLLVGAEEPIKIRNKFIVYILYGENNNGPDVIYVGKSTNGLKNRPTSHADKYERWTYCYVLTQFEERTFFNDGTIQYIEDKVNKKVNDLNHYLNTTKVTNAGTANSFDMEDCDAYLEKAYEMLDVIGLDLITYSDPETEKMEDDFDGSNGGVVPEGIYAMQRKLKKWGNRVAKARMQVAGGKFIVLKGSNCCPNEGPGLFDAVRIKRQSADVVDGILMEDVVFDSPSGASSFVIGGASNGWRAWRKSDGEPISVYRPNK